MIPEAQDRAGRADANRPPAPDAVSTAAPTGSAPSAPQWADRLLAGAAALAEWLSRPRVRLTVIGVTLLLVGGVFVTSSLWTLPLVVAGALMVVVAWVGRRLDGRFSVEWGETGTQLEFRAEIKAVQSARPAPRELMPTTEPEPEDAEVVDGEAHTVEIEVAELKALIAAAQTAEAETAHTDASALAARNLRVANGGGRSSEAAR